MMRLSVTAVMEDGTALATLAAVFARVDALTTELGGLPGVEVTWETMHARGQGNGNGAAQAPAAVTATKPASSKGNRYRGYEDDAVLRAAALAELVRLAQNGVAPSQERFNEEKDATLPTAAAITHRLGSWEKLCGLAGLTPRQAEYRKVWGAERRNGKETSGDDDESPEEDFPGVRVA